jgi:four helix bundle protein
MRVGEDIARRLRALALSTIRVAQRLPRTVVARHVAGQLARSGTAGGANYEEARAAESREDFAHKVGIAGKEVREAGYWLTIVEDAGWIKEGLSGPIEEARQLAAILAASRRTARSRSAAADPPPIP